MSRTNPQKFDDLDAGELYRSALEDFALPVEEGDKGKKKVLVAAFVEGGVTWADYVDQHPELAPEPEEVVAVVEAPAVITANPPAHNTVEPLVEEPVAVIVDTGIKVNEAQSSPFLIKMIRENPLYETRGYRFTSEHPYALVKPEDAQYILEREDGFRQALPSELEEFYG